MILSDVNPTKLKDWIDKNVTDDLLREILDEWSWQEDPPDVIVEDERILGFCASREEHGFYKCCYLFVDSSQRGRGYGRELLELSFIKAKKKGLPYLYVSEERFDGWKIFKSHNFPYEIKRSEGLKDYYFVVDTTNRSHLFN